MLKRLSAVFVAITVFALTSLKAQDQQPRKPVVGIALSGGGALGIAHIGVLRYLEEQRIPVDRIAGTSMGGLLGGLYATGHDAADLERIIREADWDDLLRTTPKFEDRSVAEKQEWNRVTGPSSLRLGRGFTLPPGINSAQPLVQLLSGETAAYWDVQDFDQLPIPFRGVATDLLSGEAFVLREGRLAKALRATMAIPAIFTPVEWDGRLLSDGGIVNNLPTDVARAMGADFVIGVTMRVSPASVQELDSLQNVLRQTVNIAVVQNELRNAPLADVEITVQMGNRSSMDFSDTQSLIELGYNAAAQNRSRLERLSLPPGEWAAYLQARKSRERAMPSSGPIVDVESPQPVIRRHVESELLRKAGGTVSRRELEAILAGVIAATGLPTSFYGWHTGPDGKSGYQVAFDPRRSTEILLRPSVFFQLSGGEPSRAAFRLSGAAIWKNAYKSRLLAELHLGSNPALSLEYYRPIGGSAYFIAPGLSVERTRHSLYNGKRREDAVRDRFTSSLYFGVGTWRHLQLRVGARAGYDAYGDSANASFDVADTAFVNPEVTVIINTQDSGLLPKRGLRLNAAAGWSLREHSFPYLQTSFDHFQPLGGQISLFATGQAGASMGRRLNVYDQFTAGGLNQLDAYRYQELRADTLVAAGGGVLYRGANPKEKVFRPIFGSWYEAAGLNSADEDWKVRHSATLGVFAPTPVGLAGLTFSVDLRGSVRFRFSLGSFWNRP